MGETPDSLTILFPNNMIPVICVAHKLHRVYETISLKYFNIDNMISLDSWVKKVFSKAQSRALKFRELPVILQHVGTYHMAYGELD